MNTTNNHNANNSDNNADTFLESLRYDSLFSNQTFEIDSENNLRITELSALKRRKEIVPLDLINPQPISKKCLNKPLMLLALASTLASGAFFASTIFMGQIWAVAFAIVFWIFGMGTLVAAYKSRTTVYQYKFASTESLLFSISESSAQNQQVKMFVNVLNKRIISLNEKSERSESMNITALNEESITSLDNTSEIGIYTQGKQSQYMRHLDFLFNHGIVNEVLYKKLNEKIDKRIADSESRFMNVEPDTFDDQTVPNNIINFPVNA